MTKKNQERVLMLTTLAFVFTALFLLPATSDATDADEYFIQHEQRRYFELPKNAREVGLGGSSLATAMDVAAAMGNPAGLGWMAEYEISLSYRFDELSGDDFPMLASIGDDDLHTGMFQFAVPLKKGEWGVLGFGASLYDSDIEDSVNTANDGFTLHLSYAKVLCEEWSVGYALGYYNEEEHDIYESSDMDAGFTNRLGVQYRPSERLTLGLSGFYGTGVTDMESSIKILGSQDADRESWGLDLGVPDIHQGHRLSAEQNTALPAWHDARRPVALLISHKGDNLIRVIRRGPNDSLGLQCRFRDALIVDIQPVKTFSRQPATMIARLEGLLADR